MRRLHKSGTDGMKIGYGWGMYKLGIDKCIGYRCKLGIDGMKVRYR